MTVSPFLSLPSRSESGKVTISDPDLTELGLSAAPDHSELTTMGRFLADGGIGLMEKLIRFSVLAATKEGAGEGGSSRKKTSSVVVEVGSVCSLNVNRIVRDFGEQ